ncbi:MAG: hypothetical protein IKQ48_06525 [Paludibacteraceae bacterium]|nr:hypothetical protein [Paludibacteraceae bacterium]
MTKKILSVLGFGMIAMLIFVSCEGGGGSKVSSMQFKRMNIAGAKALALASDAGNHQKMPARLPAALMDEGDPEYNISNPIFTVSEDGTLVEVHYTIEVVGNGEIVDMIKANMRLKAQYIYAIGDEWLWLVNCEYDYPGIDEVKEPLKGQIRELMHAAFESNFLVRRSDGALFAWSREQGCPQKGRGYKQPSDIYGQVESVGKDVFSCPSMGGLDDYYGRIYKLEDQGDVLNVVQVLSSSQAGNGLYVDDRGFIGTMLSTMGVEIPVIIDPSSLKLSNINAGEAQLEKPEFIAIGGRAYIYAERYITTTETDGKEGSWEVTKHMGYFYALENQSGMWTVKTPALYEFDREQQSGPTQKVYKTPVATWMGTEYDANWTARSYIYTFDPMAPSFSKKELPEHYPVDETKYYDGVAYVMGEGQSFFYVCDLAKDAAEQVEIQFDESIAEYISQIAFMGGFSEYDPNTQCFTGGAQLLDGTYLYFILYAQGENRGKVTVLHEGESDAGQVISVMVRLN